MPRANSFYDTLTAAINDMAERGFSSQERLKAWIDKIRTAAEHSMTPAHVLEYELKQMMKSIYKKQVDQGLIFRQNPGVSRFTLQKVKPKLRAELDRRIMASANLIKLNRQASIEKTLQRFSGWATSIPIGGSDAVDKRETKTEIRKALSQLPFEERRVLIDQGHKFTSNLSDILAVDGNAIAAEWNSHWRQSNYNYRKDHKVRDQRVYAIRGSWAIEKGLMKVGPNGYTDEITKPGEEVFCRCFYRYLYNVSDLPEDMLTKKGKEQLALVKERMLEDA